MPPNPTISPSSKALQENLHILLSRLASTIEHVKNWPEAKGDDASIHVESTSKLIAGINQVIDCLQKVEATVQSDAALRKKLQDCLIPYDLLDLLDSNLNPDCFCRGLLREALGQLAGLQRRKLALEMLGAAVQSGLNKQLAENNTRLKRARSEAESSVSDQPPSKKAHVSESDKEGASM